MVKSGRVLPDALAAESVADIVKGYAAAAGFDASDFAGHSLRAGFLTSGAERGASIFKLMEVSRHRSVETLRGYVRRADLFRDHAGAGRDSFKGTALRYWHKAQWGATEAGAMPGKSAITA